MLKMELKEGTRVVTTDGKEVGKVNRFVIDPVTNEVTHIVVQKGWLLTEDKVVPLHQVNTATEHDVILNDTVGDFDDLPPFEESHFVRVDGDDTNRTTAGEQPQAGIVPAYYWYPTGGYLGFPASGIGYENWPQVEMKQNIPEDTVALKEGSKVVSSDDKHVGNIEQLLVDPESNRATHFIISQGVFFKDRKVVPARWVKTIAEDSVHLAVTSTVLENLPSYNKPD